MYFLIYLYPILLALNSMPLQIVYWAKTVNCSWEINQWNPFSFLKACITGSQKFCTDVDGIILAECKAILKSVRIPFLLENGKIGTGVKA